MPDRELPEGVPFDRWSHDLQLYALDRIKREIPKQWRPFYCTRRECDGRPHVANDGWDFPHARWKQHPPASDWFIWLIKAGRSWGKLARLSTPVPTPHGWTTMGELVDGDQVFDEAGKVCTVVKAHPPEMPERAYEFTFSDGTVLVTGGEHQWVTWTHADRKAYNRNVGDGIPDNWPTWRSVATYRAMRVPSERLAPAMGLLGPSIKTTQQIVDTFTQKDGTGNHSIPTCGALDIPAQDLPIDPYVLGVWLGDGCSYSATITQHIDDLPFLVSQLESAGYQARTKLDRNNTWTVTCPGFRRQLMALGLIRNKHVPQEYLWGSIDQRYALLQGLLDTDGYIEPSKVEFTNTNIDIAMAVVHLARSLGEKPVFHEGIATLNGRTIGPKYRVTWRPTMNPFRMPRKRNKYVATSNSRNYHRTIVAVREVELELMRCITVDSPNSLYLMGDGMIPTHNTLTASKYFNKVAERPTRIHLIGKTRNDIRMTMVEGISGLQATAPPGNVPFWEPSKLKLTWPSGAVAIGFSGEEPDALRGPQAEYTWLDEPAHIPLIEDVWMNLTLGLREGEDQRVVMTSTPLPSRWMKKIVADPDTHVTDGSSWENAANLSEKYKRKVLEPLKGTRIGQQEIEGKILSEVEGALWTTEIITKVDQYAPDVRDWEFDRIVVAIDPAGGARTNSDETGIIVLGRIGPIVYVLADASGKYTPLGWANRAIQLYDYWKADAIVAEVNFGRDMVTTTIEATDAAPRIIPVESRRGKVLRAEPVVALYERSRVVHFPGLVDLEDQMIEWVPGQGSPDRIDALVHGVTELAIMGQQGQIGTPYWILRQMQSQPLLPSVTDELGFRNAG